MKRNYLQRLFAILDQWKGWYIFSATLLFLSNGFRMLEPKILQVAVDGIILHYINGNEKPEIGDDPVAGSIYKILPDVTTAPVELVLFALGVLYFVIALVRSASEFSATAITAKCTESAIKQLRTRIFKHIQYLSVPFHHNYNTGEMIQRCTGDISTIRQFIMTQVTELIRMSGIFIVSFLLMYLTHKTYAFIAICIVPFILITAFLFFKKEAKVWEKHEDEADKLTSIVNENLNGIRVVQAFAQQESEIEKFKEQNLKKRAIGLQHVRLHSLFWPFSDAMVHFQIALTVAAGGYFVLNNSITLGELTSFYTYGIMVTWPMRQIGRIVSQMGMATVAMQRMSTILDEKLENDEGKHIPINPLCGEIEFKNVSFTYPKKEDGPTINNLSFTIAAGEKVAFVGPTGSGKSTIIALLLRFYEPDSGDILIDGKKLSEYPKTWLRDRIGVVQQNSFLFSSTIGKNITYARKDFEYDEMIRKATSAHIHQVIDVFPNGYDTVVGEKGVSLSGGQKQRISLARALMSNPDIMILDDATSAVDTETEFGIQDALKKDLSDLTTLIISHRITSIQWVDKVITIENGRISSVGNPEELLKQSGYYRNMVQVQLALEEDILNSLSNDTI